MTTPDGSPAWMRVAAHTDYGGNVNKTNYLSRGVIDALTDVGAEAICRMAADLEACSRTCPFVTITFGCNDVGPGAPIVSAVYMMTGIRTTIYAADTPPTGFPSAARNGNGDVTFTFASTYSDAYGVSGAFTPQHAVAGLYGAQAGSATCVISGQTVRVRAFVAAGTALSDAVLNLQVW